MSCFPVRAVLFAFLALAELANAQERCLTMPATERAASLDEGYRSGLLNLVYLADSFALTESPSPREVKIVDIPVVVHVLYSDEDEIVSIEQVQSQIHALNRDFNWEQSDKGKIPSIWSGLGASTGFRFHLADKDPDGNFTHGVTWKRVYVEDIGSTDYYYQSNWGGTDPWPQPHYLNVWVCDIEGLTIGFAVLPSSNMAVNDGIVMSPRAFGTMGTAQSPYNHGRTFVHEVGHYFGLRHIWGDNSENCTSTDYISDTPWQLKANYGCKTFPQISCASEPNGDMFMNFMDYGNDTCMLLFTQKQVQFMQLILRTSRAALIQSPGYTGLNHASNNSSGVLLYPNPASDWLHLHLSVEDINHDLIIQSAAGIEVMRWRPSHKNEMLNVSALSPGFYTIHTGLWTKAMIIQR